MKITLVRPPFYSLFGVANPKMKSYPLNLLYLATYARDVGGHEVRIVDGETLDLIGPDAGADPAADPGCAVHDGIARMVGFLDDPALPLWSELEDRILAHAPDLVGITCNSGNMDTVRVLVGRLKARGLPVILGGSHPTALPEQSIAYTGAGMVAIGEGERTLVAVADALAGTRRLSGIPALAHRVNGEVRINPGRELIDPIDQLPLPDRSFVDRADYFGDAIMTGRGCPFDCVYCASRNIWGKRVRLRSVGSIVAELEMIRASVEEERRQALGGGGLFQQDDKVLRPELAEHMVNPQDDHGRSGVLPCSSLLKTPDLQVTDQSPHDLKVFGDGGPGEGAFFKKPLPPEISLLSSPPLLSSLPHALSPPPVVKVLDDTFTVNRRRTIALLDAFLAAGLNWFEFTGGVRADTLDLELVQKMARCNFKRVTLGVESGSPRILKMIRKGETNEDVKRAVLLLRDAGIKSHAFFMIGLPGETPDDIELSKRLILEVRPDHVEINMVTPYPGTDLFPMLIHEDPLKIDRWYRWFHQGLSTHSDRLGYDLDKAYEEFTAFAQGYNEGAG